MSRIPQHVIDEILSRVSIAELIGEFTKVERKGRTDQFMALCPFHAEKTPSFSISDSKGVYYCFGCQARGNAVTFLTEHNGLGFRDVMEELARRAGVEIPRDTETASESRKRSRARDLYLNVMRVALEHFERSLWSGGGQEARDYLAKRGIDEETARKFRLGFAPEGWQHLIDGAREENVSERFLERAGLAVRRDNGGHYDRFRNRIMFPVLDVSGRCLAFSGRTLDPEERAKYINSPETRFYTKGKHLFGLHAARKAIRKKDSAVLVEGNFDVVALHARGIDNVIAPLGTALTPEQCHLIHRFSDHVVLALDGDRAGQEAARKALLELLSEGVLDIRQVRFDDGEDPDDYVQNHGAEALAERIRTAPSMLDVTLDEILAPALGAGNSAATRKALDESAELVAAMSDEAQASTLISMIARRIELDGARNRVRREVARKRAERRKQREAQEAYAKRQEEAEKEEQDDRPETRPGRALRVERDRSEGPNDPRPAPPPSDDVGDHSDDLHVTATPGGGPPDREIEEPIQKFSTLELQLMQYLHESPERLKTLQHYHVFPLLTHRELAKVLEAAATKLNQQGSIDLAAEFERSGSSQLSKTWYEVATDRRGFVPIYEDEAFENTVKDLLIVGLRKMVVAIDRKIYARNHASSSDFESVRRLLERKRELVAEIDKLRGYV